MLDILLNSDLIRTLFKVLLFLTPLSALLIYVLFRNRVHNLETFTKILILIGLIGPVNLILWSIYNAIENHFGLDSVVALIINFAIFVNEIFWPRFLGYSQRDLRQHVRNSSVVMVAQ